MAIDKYVTEHPALFEDYNVGQIRKQVGFLDQTLSNAFDALLDPEKNHSGINIQIQKMIDHMKKSYGEKHATFYDLVYGCVLAEQLGDNFNQGGEEK